MSDLVEDPSGSGLYVPPFGVVEDPPGSGLYMLSIVTVEHPADSGLYSFDAVVISCPSQAPATSSPSDRMGTPCIGGDCVEVTAH
jgi:hypothetical protein